MTAIDATCDDCGVELHDDPHLDHDPHCYGETWCDCDRIVCYEHCRGCARPHPVTPPDDAEPPLHTYDPRIHQLVPIKDAQAIADWWRAFMRVPREDKPLWHITEGALRRLAEATPTADGGG